VSEEPNIEAPSLTALIQTVTDQIQAVIEEADAKTRPLEMEPYRGRLFETFVMADGAGLLDETVEPNLTADEITRILAERWQLRDIAAQSAVQQTKLPEESLTRMRLLWSFLRMWMEWSYAWQRWSEFHDGEKPEVI